MFLFKKYRNQIDVVTISDLTQLTITSIVHRDFEGDRKHRRDAIKLLEVLRKFLWLINEVRGIQG